MSGRDVGQSSMGELSHTAESAPFLQAWPRVPGKDVYFWPNLSLWFQNTGWNPPHCSGNATSQCLWRSQGWSLKPQNSVTGCPNQGHTHALWASFKSCWFLCLEEARPCRDKLTGKHNNFLSVLWHDIREWFSTLLHIRTTFRIQQPSS